MIQNDGFSVWRDSVVRERLGWYYGVMRNTKPSKLLVAKRIPYTEYPENASTESLWADHEVLSEHFKATLTAIRTGRLNLERLSEPQRSLMDVKAELLNRILRRCELCEWRCRIDRVKNNRKGVCRVGAETRVSTWFPHYGEELPLISGGGSGTIFFTGCTFRCCFCQNWEISQDSSNGVVVDGRRLVIMMKNLRVEGATNINFVGGDPTPNLHTIFDGMRRLEVNVPILWNSNLYLTSDAMSILRDVIDIWLPDFKWGNDRCAIRLSKAARYWETITRNLEVAQLDGDMIIRHLVMPGHIECCTRPILMWIARNCPGALVNIMGQYRPDSLVPIDSKYEDIDRYPSAKEMDSAYRYADQFGIAYRPIT
jgi:putative pyruvate formate lyase activating enzyme